MRRKMIVTTLVVLIGLATTASASAQWVRTYSAPAFPGFCAK
jgi:hypothetical protein